jgi:hypothetical protein
MSQPEATSVPMTSELYEAKYVLGSRVVAIANAQSKMIVEMGDEHFGSLDLKAMQELGDETLEEGISFERIRYLATEGLPNNEKRPKVARICLPAYLPLPTNPGLLLISSNGILML